MLVGATGETGSRTQHFVEYDQRGVCKNGLHLAYELDQCRQTAQPLEARELLGAQDRRFAGNCCIAGAVNALFAVRPDAELADGL
jgi:hypothetical protein